jgi:hypothetical protein
MGRGRPGVHIHRFAVKVNQRAILKRHPYDYRVDCWSDGSCVEAVELSWSGYRLCNRSLPPGGRTRTRTAPGGSAARWRAGEPAGPCGCWVEQWSRADGLAGSRHADHCPPPAAQQRDRLQARRLPRGRTVRRRRPPSQDARRFGVTPQAVSVWHARFKAGGSEALHHRGPTAVVSSIPRLVVGVDTRGMYSRQVRQAG